MSPIKQTHPPPSPCAHVGVCRHCTWFFILIIVFHFIPISVMSRPIEHVVIYHHHTPCMPPLPIYTLTCTSTHIPHLPLQDNLLTQGEQRPSLHPPHPPGHVCTMGCAPRCEVCLRYFTKSLRATVFMQTVYSTVVQGNSNWVCDKGVNLTNKERV